MWGVLKQGRSARLECITYKLLGSFCFPEADIVLDDHRRNLGFERTDKPQIKDASPRKLDIAGCV